MGQFTLDLTKFVKKANGRIDEVVQKVTLDIFGNVIMKSPVDTGRFRANWIASVGSYGTETTEGFDKSGSATTGKVSEVIMATKAGNVVYMVNSLPYARRLEYGYSQQAPNGMVRTSVSEYQNFINKALSI